MTATDVDDRLERLRQRMHAEGVPEHITGMFARYVEHGLHPGAWGEAVLRNDLAEAVLLADGEAALAIAGIVRALHEVAPVWAWGHPDRVVAWRGVRGLRGMQHRPQGPTRRGKDPGGPGMR